MVKVDNSSRQQEIIEASGRILITRGIKALTTKSLASEMGFSESAIYRHFENKEAIIISLFEYLLKNFRFRIGEILSLELASKDKLNKVFNSQCTFFSQNPHFIMAVLADEIYYESEKVKVALLEIMSYKANVIENILLAGLKDGAIRSDIQVSELKHTIIGSFRLLLLKWRISNFEFDLEIAGKKMMRTLNLLIQKQSQN